MKRLVLALVLLGAAAQQPAMAKGACYSKLAMEADQAIRFMTELMVVSSTCAERVYPEFRLRNKDAIIYYQKTLIQHFHSTARFDAWNTALANEISLHENTIPSAQICVQAAAILNQGKALDPAGFRAYAAAQASSASGQYAKCRK